MKGNSRRLDQAEDRISKLEDKMETKGKPEELLVKLLKTCERNMQEFTNSIKAQTLEAWALKNEKRSKQK
jgi:biotin-(acetyl-CoA carboxylase) ligase